MFSDGSSITNMYDADGSKLRTTRNTVLGGTTTSNVTDYCGDLILEQGIPSRILTGYGYASITSLSSNQWTPTTASYSYYIKDHLGSVRIVASSSGSVQQKNVYYAFGGLMSDQCTSFDVQPYRFQGKELDRMHSLEWNDHGARFADLLTARWMTMDPLCEKFYGMSPYLLCGGNMVNAVDDDGMKTHNWIFRKNKENDPRDYDIYNNSKRWEDRVINIFAHGFKELPSSRKPTTKEYMSVALQVSETGVGIPHEYHSDNAQEVKRFASKIRSSDENFTSHSNGDPIVVLHSCATSVFAQEISANKEFKDVVIIAPNANVHVNGGKKGKETVNSVYNEGTGKTTKGEWRVYRNGKEVLNKDGKPITYPANALPGSVGFIYGF